MGRLLRWWRSLWAPPPVPYQPRVGDIYVSDFGMVVVDEAMVAMSQTELDAMLEEEWLNG